MLHTCTSALAVPETSSDQGAVAPTYGALTFLETMALLLTMGTLQAMQFSGYDLFEAAARIISLEACQRWEGGSFPVRLTSNRAKRVKVMLKHLKHPLEKENEPSSLKHSTVGGTGL